jgi:alpha-1,2-mannosyltransferase
VAVALAVLYAAATLTEVHEAFKWKPRVDFTMYRDAARTALTGGDLYHFHEARGDMPYPYPPLLASVLSPLGLVRLAPAYHIWAVLLMVFLALTVYLTFLILNEIGAPRPALMAAGALLLSLFLLDSNIYWGQVNLPVTALTAWGVLMALRKRSVPAGVLLGIAAALKVLPAALLLWFVIRRDWRAVAAFIGAAVGSLILIPSLVGGVGWAWKMNLEWLKLFWSAIVKGGEGLQSHGGYTTAIKNGSLSAVVDRLFGGYGHKAKIIRFTAGSVKAISFTLRAAVVCVTAAAVIRQFRPRTEAVERYLWPLTASLLLLCGWLVNLLMWDHHTIGLLMILPVVGAVCLDPGLPPRWRLPLWVGLLSAAAALTSGFFPGSRRWGLQTLCYLALWGGIAWSLLSAPPADEPSAAASMPAA